jgi:demethoxyubiquinone hydroxylase (CLK1/Coq7/Cat5 family)
MTDLIKEQENTLNSPRLKYGILAKILFFTMDLFYGKKSTLSKFKVLEIVARVPYQAWEQVAYIAITHKFRGSKFSRRIFDFVKSAREQQDNEQWHLFILEEELQKNNIKENYFLYRIVPQILAFFYYHISWFLYVIKPKLSYELNAHFEDHAEHEYMNYVKDNPELEKKEFNSIFEKDYGSFKSFADLLRQIGVDERHHKNESLSKIADARF